MTEVLRLAFRFRILDNNCKNKCKHNSAKPNHFGVYADISGSVGSVQLQVCSRWG